MNKKIYIGIGLLVGGSLASVILFNILPLLMGIGHVMSVAGLLVLIRGISKSKNGTDAVQPPVDVPDIPPGTPPVQHEYCTRCGKDITDLFASQLFEIDGKKYQSIPNIITFIPRGVSYKTQIVERAEMIYIHFK